MIDTTEYTWGQPQRIINDNERIFVNNNGRNKSDFLLNAFADPLSVLPAGEVDKLNLSPEDKEKAVTHGKKYIVAKTLADQFGTDVNLVMDGFEPIVKQIWPDKNYSSDELYTIFGDMYRQQAERKSFAERSAYDAAVGVYSADKGLADTMAVGTQFTAFVHENMFKPVAKGVAETLDFFIPGTALAVDFDQYSNEPSFLRQFQAGFTQYSDFRKQQIDQLNVSRGAPDGFTEKLTSAVIQNLPSMAVGIYMGAGKVLSVGKFSVSNAGLYFGASTGSSEYMDTRNDTNMTETQRILNALAVGTAEIAFEEWLGVPKVARKYWGKPDLLKADYLSSYMRAAKHLGIDAALEGVGEGATGIAQRFANLAFNKDGQSLRTMSKSEISDFLLSDVPLEMAVGAVYAGTIGVTGIARNAKLEQLKAINMQKSQAYLEAAAGELTRLKAIDKPTPLEIRMAERLDSAIKADDPVQVDAAFKQSMLEIQEQAGLSDEELAAKSVNRLKELLYDDKNKVLFANERFNNTMLEFNSLIKAFPHLDDLRLSIVENENQLPKNAQQDIASHGYRGRAEGYFDPTDNTLYFVAGNISPDRVKKVFLHEVLGHYSMRQLFGDNFNRFLNQVGNSFYGDIAKFVAKRQLNIDVTTEAGLLEASDEFVAHFAEKGADASLFSKFKAAFMNLLRKIPVFRNLKLSDNDVKALVAKAYKMAGNMTGVYNNGDSLFSAAYRKEGAPNNAEKAGKIVDGNVPHYAELFNAFKLSGNRLYADYEFLLGKHNEYFKNQIEVKSAVEFVLDAPELANDINNNLTLVRKDDATGRHFRIEIRKKADPKKQHHIRSAHEITAEQYNKAKAGIESPAILPSQNSLQNAKEQGRTFSDFLNYNSTQFKNVKFSVIGANNPDIRFSVRQKSAPQKTIKAYKLFNIDEQGNPHALFIDKNNSMQLNTWYDADSPAIANLKNLEHNKTYLVDKNGNAALQSFNNKTQAPSKQEIANATKTQSRYIYVGIHKNSGDKLFYNWGVNGSGALAKFAMRPGWHATNVPSARHIGEQENGKVMYRRDNERWFEIEMAADVDYNNEAKQNKSKDIPDHLPNDGWYKFQTNTNANKAQDWYISGAIKIVRPLSTNEVNDISNSMEYAPDLPYKNSHDIRFSVFPVWTGSAADYEQPSLQYIGSGEGQQAFGWGLYGTDSRKVAEWYAEKDVERKNTDSTKHLYKQTFWPDKTDENLIRWDEHVDDYVGDCIKYALEGNENISEEDGLKIWDIAEAIRVGQTGEWLYNELVDVLGSPKAASEFLKLATINGIMYPINQGDSDGFNYVIFSDKQIRVDEHIRFSVAEDLDESADFIASAEALANIILPLANTHTVLRADEIIGAAEAHGIMLNLEQHGKLMLKAAELAMALKSERNQAMQEAKQQEFLDYIYETELFYRYARDYTGKTDFKIVPSNKFKGTSFSGSFIADEWKQYAMPSRKSGNAMQDLATMQKRDDKLKNATGTASDLLAKDIAERTGRDAVEVEEELVAYFADLTKKDLRSKFAKEKRDKLARDKDLDRQAKLEFEMQEQNRLDDAVTDILERGNQLEPDILETDYPVFENLYKHVMKHVPNRKLTPADVDAVNYALQHDGESKTLLATTIKDAKKAAFKEYLKQLTAMRNELKQDNLNLNKLQKHVAQFAKKYLSDELRSDFTDRIFKLAEYTGKPSIKYPDGRRQFEFEQLLKDILATASDANRSASMTEIKKMLDAVKTKRNYKGIPTSVIPSEVASVNRIRQIFGLSAGAWQNLINDNMQRLAEAEASGSLEAISRIEEDNHILDLFGGLAYRSDVDAVTALNCLKKLIYGAKADFRNKLAERMNKVTDMRRNVKTEASFGKNNIPLDRAKKHWDFILKNCGLSTIMRIVSGQKIQDFDNSQSGKLFKQVEAATQNEQTRLRSMQNAFDSTLLKIAKIDSLLAKGKYLSRLNKIEENSGVFVNVYTSIKDGMTVDGKRSLKREFVPIEDYDFKGVIMPGAKTLLAEFKNGKSTHFKGLMVDEVSADFLQRQIDDYDSGVVQSYREFSESVDDANMEALIKDAIKQNKVTLFAPNIEAETVQTKELALSQGSALQIFLTHEQADYANMMKFNGWTEKSIGQLKAFIKPEVLELGYWMRDYIKQQRSSLDKLVFDRYGAHLPVIVNYFPASFKDSIAKKMLQDDTLGRAAGQMSVNPAFLIARKFHLKQVDLNTSAFTTFFANQVEQSHFLAWSEPIRDLRSVYGSNDVQSTITAHLGRNVVENLVERIDTIARGGGDSMFAAKFLNNLYRHWVPAKIAFNLSSFLKQMAGTAAYMNHVPVTDFAKNIMQANPANPDFNRFFDRWKNSDYAKNRLAGGLNQDLIYMLNYSRNNAPYAPWADTLMQYGTKLTLWGDAVSSASGGYAAYKYYLDKFLVEGKTRAAAEDEAFSYYMRATDETQQSGYLKDLNYFQANQGAFRYLTAFLSNPIQVMNLEFQVFNELRYGTDKKAAAKKVARTILVNHIIIPTLMTFITDLLGKGLDWDEYEWEDYLIAGVMGNFEGLFLLGKVFSGLANLQADKLLGHKGYAPTMSALPIFDDVTRDVLFLNSRFSGKDFEDVDYWNLIKATGDFGMVGGIFDNRVGAVGMILHAIGAQGKRFAKLTSDK